MSFSVIYLIQRLIHSIYTFLYRWYIGGFRLIGGKTVIFLEHLDRFWALKITALNLFEPLYQDQTFVGRILGFVFRSFSIVCATVIYLVIILIAILLYAGFAWILPAVALYGLNV